jgi:ribose transport system permease protein
MSPTARPIAAGGSAGSRSDRPHLTGRARAAVLLRNYGAPLFLLFLAGANAIITPNFLTVGTMRNLLVQAYPILIAALGMAIVIASGGIDISVGSVMAIAGSVAAKLMVSGAGLALSIFAGMLAACLCGAFSGTMIARFRIQPIVITLILIIGCRGLAQIILGELFISFYDTPFAALGSYAIGGSVPVQIAIMVAAVAAMYFVCNVTNFGSKIEAVGDNPRAARLSGIHIPDVLLLAYMACGLLAGLAGIVEAARINAVNAGSLGLYIELDAIAAVAIGGTPFSGGRARVLRTAVGALIVQMVNVVVNMNNIQFHYSLVVKAVVIILALYTQRESS